MTPSPTPTPTTDACFYRDAEFNDETVHVLVDAFGRMLTQDDGGTVGGVAWNENGVTPDFETNGDYAAQFNAIRTAFGESDVITDITDNTVTFTDAEGGSVLLSFDSEKKEFVPIVSEIENGTPNMFYRTLNDGNADVTFVCDADGKVCYFGAGYLLLVTNGDEITQSSDGALLSRLYTACGGSTEITNHVSADGDYNKYTLDDFSFVTEAHGGVTFGEVNIWPPVTQKLYAVTTEGVEDYYLGNYEGKVLSFTYGVDTGEHHVAIAFDRETSKWDFSEFVGGISEAFEEIEVPVETTDGNTYRFSLYGVDYVLVGYGLGDEPWLTPNNVVEYA